MKLIILIAHYNNPEGLENSLSSIDEPFEVDVLIVDDGSTIKPDYERLKENYENGKLFIEQLPENKGVGVAANYGLTKIQEMNYELIGRLDCGDLNRKNKYKIQIDYLKKNPNVKLLGTWADVVDDSGNLLYILQHPVSHNELRKKMYINSMFVNPSVIFYTDILKTVGYYPKKYRRAAQDYAFFFKVMKHFEVRNLPESLLVYIVEDRSISTQKRKLQIKHRIQIIKENFYFGFYPIYGILRSSILLYISRDTTTKFRQLFQKG